MRPFASPAFAGMTINGNAALPVAPCLTRGLAVLDAGGGTEVAKPRIKSGATMEGVRRPLTPRA
ncbi:MAG: hypothetical protein EAY70_01900 [Sphingomonadales bacterium]|nr:MAG: hypothetical protein EAY70_01900 [Sphingomonadales bacterium]